MLSVAADHDSVTDDTVVPETTSEVGAVGATPSGRATESAVVVAE